MAKNWTMKEALEAIISNDKEGIQDLGRRFPLTTTALAKGDINTIINAIPDYVTARKIEAILKDGITESVGDGDDVEEEIEEKPEKVEKPKKEKAEKSKKEKAAKKEVMPEPIEEDIEEEEEDSDDYSSMNAVDLFKLCKKRGIKAEPKKKAAEYIKLLKADDAKEAEAEEEEEEDDWDI